MPRIVDGRTISQKALAKQQIEQAMVERVYRAFGRPEALTPLRHTVKDLMTTMRSGPPQPLKRALQAESRLRVLAKYRPAGVVSRRFGPGTDVYIDAHFQTLIQNCHRFTAADCYDVIRLGGEWVEQGGSTSGWGGTTERGVTAAAEIKQSMRGGVPTAAQPRVDPSGRKWREEDLEPVAAVWADGKRDKTGVLKATYGTDFRGKPTVRDREGGRFVLPHPVRKHDPQATAGRELKRVARNSTVLKIDRLFGLSEMCDISGTTADVIFALETWGGPHLSSIYYVFPIGAVVAGAHHSVLEVALALTLARDTTIDYKIGFYRTLLPTDSARIGGGCFREVANILYHAEQMMYILQLHCLRFWHNQEPLGILFDRTETRDLKRSPLFNSSRVIEQVRGMSIRPSYDDLRWIFGLNTDEITDPDQLMQ